MTAAAGFQTWPVVRPAERAAPAVLYLLVFGSIIFNLGLCFVNTAVMGVSEIHVVACEALILSMVFLVAYRSIERIHLIVIGLTILWAISFASVRFVAGSDMFLDIKIVRDLAIPIAFYLLGTRTPNLKVADFIVSAALAIVIAVALFEYFWIETFTRFFNVARYYIARGTIEARQLFQAGDLFVSGMRPAGAMGGRNLLPFLGDHRVSSVFLEPVSMGNFGVIAFIWGLVRSRAEGRLYLGVMLGALAVVIFADSRFGAYLCLMTAFVVFLPLAWTTLGALILPAAALGALILVPLIVTGSYDPQNRYIDNGFVGRFVLSAELLGDFSPMTWFGLEAPRVQVFDSGYAYIVSKIGLIGVAIFWLALFSIKNADRQFCAFRNLAAVYLGTILCVSNSPFTIKTASLLWFLLGALAGSSTDPRKAYWERTRVLLHHRI